MRLKNITIVFSFFLLAVSCKTNPFTGKKNLNFVSNEQIFPSAFEQYNQVLAENTVVTGTREAQMIKEVGSKIATAAERFLDANGYPAYTDDYRWEFSLLKDDDMVNAWAMPGGKIAFYTGIMPIAESEAGVAAIMAHEVAHALADHGAQRMSATQLQQVGGGLLGAAVGGRSETTQQIIGQAYGLTSQYGAMLPFSRSHETEADKIGLTLMAIAGYDPMEAADLWRRMKANAGGESPPEFFSTHPSSDTRIRNIESWAPGAKAEARKYGITSFQG